MNNTNSAGSYSLGNTNNVVGVGSMNSIDTVSSNTTGGFFSNISWITWLVIILVLAFLGINIFMYLAKGTQYITDTFSPILSFFGSSFGNLLGNTTKQVVNTSAAGATAGINVVAGTVTGGIDAVQGSPSNTTTTSAPVSSTIPPPDSLQTSTLNNALNNAASATGSGSSSAAYQADDSYSSIQSANSSGKAGWCYIGEERGIRSCSQVGVNDTCMSGDIFPSNEICVNPNLRA
jgi:hypothetical protein